MSAPVQLYRSRYLPALSAAQIAALPDKAWAPVIVVTGAIEQHGPHLPVAVDAFIGETLVTLALGRLPADASCYVAPPITVGKSNEHTGFPGTLMISKRTLRAQLLSVARQVHAWGFRALCIINTHGGNTAVDLYTLREIKARYGLRTEFLQPSVDLGIGAREQAYGYHANDFESSVLLALLGQHVRQDLAVCEYCGDVDDPGELRAERAPATFAWVTQDVSQSGVMGDAPAGTAEKGRVYLDKYGAAYAAAIAAVSRDMRRG
jgi:creatinine amidohydrolase